MNKNVYRLLMTVGIVGTLLMASLTPAFAAKVEIDFWHAMSGQLGETVQTLVDQFNASQDQYVVKAVNKGNYSEAMTASIAAYRAKNPPHVVQVYEVGTQTMMMSGAVYPVYQLMKDAGYNIDWDRFVGPVLSYYSKDGNLYSMPFNSSTPIFYYNKTAFEKAGLDPNKPPTTWQEVEAYSRKILEAGSAKAGFSVGWPSWTMVENMHAWHNLPIATNENGFKGLDTKLLINDDFGVMHIGKLAEWQKQGIFEYGGRRGDSVPMFVNGQVAMYINSSAYIGSMSQSIKDFQWGTAMLPHWGAPYAKGSSIIGGATLWVLKGHDAKENKGTAAFLKFLSDPKQQAFWHKSTGYVPISKGAQELLEQGGYLDENPNQRTAYDQLTLNDPTPVTRGVRLGNFVQIRDVIEEELENIFNGSKTAKRGLDDAVRRSNQLLEDFALLYR